MKNYEKEFMRKIYKEIKLLQETGQRKELIKFINLAHIRAIEKISKDNPHVVLFLDFSSSDKGFDCGFDIYKSGYYLKKESIKIMVKKP